MPAKKSKTPKFYTITEAAKKLKVSRAAVHEAIQKKRIEAKWGEIVTVTKGWRISAKDLRGYQVSLSHQIREKKT